MADIHLDTQGAPASPGAGSSLLYPDSTSKRWTTKDENAKILTLPALTNANTADVVATSVDTYLTGSSLIVPVSLLQVGAIFRWRFAMSKSAAGVATPLWNVRVGTAGSTADTSRILFTGVAQTGVADNGYAEIEAIVRSIGAAGVMAGVYKLGHLLAITGLSTSNPDVKQTTSAGFDMTVASLIVGVSCNPGASGVWTFQLVSAEVVGL